MTSDQETDQPFVDQSNHVRRENRFEPGLFEKGLLWKIRDWTDVIGPLRLIRVLRSAASPVCLFVVMATYLVWGFGFSTFLSPRVPATVPELASLETVCQVVAASNPSTAWLLAMPSSAGDPNWVPGFLSIAWSVIVWVPAAVFLARQGALLTAGRTLESFSPLAKRSLARSPATWIASLVPSLCTAVFAVGGWVLLIVLRLVSGIPALENVLCFLVTLIAIPMGMLLFGSFVAFPLATASIANEPHADPLDSLSRGYESLYRRPVHLLAAVLMAIILVALVAGLAGGVAYVSSVAMDWVATMAGVNAAQRMKLVGFILQIPAVVMLTTWWAMVGGVYLLARQATGEQEPEDLWMPDVPPPPSMPTVRVD